MQVTRIAEARAYEAAEHFDMRCLRLQGKEATQTDSVWVGLSHLLPGGHTSMRDAAVEKIYVVIAGELTVCTPDERVTLFVSKVEAAAGTATMLASAADVPGAVADFLRAQNLPMAVRRGGDPRLAAMPWNAQRTLEVSTGASDGHQLAAVSHAFAGVAETGTLVMMSGPDNPTTLNFLPDNHIVVLDARDLVGDMEAALARLRARHGKAAEERLARHQHNAAVLATVEREDLAAATEQHQTATTLLLAREQADEEA